MSFGCQLALKVFAVFFCFLFTPQKHSEFQFNMETVDKEPLPIPLYYQFKLSNMLFKYKAKLRFLKGQSGCVCAGMKKTFFETGMDIFITVTTQWHPKQYS